MVERDIVDSADGCGGGLISDAGYNGKDKRDKKDKRGEGNTGDSRSVGGILDFGIEIVVGVGGDGGAALFNEDTGLFLVDLES